MLDVNDPDFYEWETHIFFDDAMEPDDTGKEFQVSVVNVNKRTVKLAI